MLIPLHVVAYHAAMPDFAPGAVFKLMLDAGALALVLPCSPAVLRRLSDAIRDGALEVGPHGPGGTVEEIEAHVTATRDALLAQLTALVGPPQPGGDPHSSLTAA